MYVSNFIYLYLFPKFLLLTTITESTPMSHSITFPYLKSASCFSILWESLSEHFLFNPALRENGPLYYVSYFLMELISSLVFSNQKVILQNAKETWKFAEKASIKNKYNN